MNLKAFVIRTKNDNYLVWHYPCEWNGLHEKFESTAWSDMIERYSVFSLYGYHTQINGYVKIAPHHFYVKIT